MRYLATSPAAFCLAFMFGPSIASAQAQKPATNSSYYASNGTGSDDNASATAAETATSVVLMGKITSPTGALPGAVIILTATRKTAVTNSNGEFQFMVPANAGPLQALVTYAGYADEKITLNASTDGSTVNLANAQIIVVSRKQQFKAYLKTARKDMKRSLRQVHRATR